MAQDARRSETAHLGRHTVVNSSRYIVDRPKEQTLHDGDVSGVCVQKTQYDWGGGYAANPVAPANLVKQRMPIETCSDTTYAETRTSYDSYGNATSVIVENGVLDMETRYTYPDGIYLASATEENGANDLVTVYAYDVYGRLETTTLPNGVQQRTVYDPFGRVCAQERRPVGGNFAATLRFAYSDSDGLASACTETPLGFPAWSGLAVFQQTAADGVSLEHSEDVDVWPGGLASFTFYDGLGRAVTEQRERNHDSKPWTTSHRQYDALGQLSEEWLPYGAENPSGNLSTVGPTTTSSYDALGRLRITTLPDQSQTSVAYAPNSNFKLRTQTATDARGNRTTRLYDVFGNLARVLEQPDPLDEANNYAVTGYGYDVRGLLVSVVDDADNETQIVYDAAGRKTSLDDPDMGTWHYTYDLAGNLRTQVDPLGQATCSYVDRLSRPVNKKYVTGIGNPSTYACPASFGSYDASFSYCNSGNGAGQRCTASNGNAAISYTYNSRGLLWLEEKSGLPGLAGSYQAAFTYDDLDRVSGIQYPDNDQVTIFYDAGGQPYALWGGGETLAIRTTYRPWGAMNRQHLGNGLWLDNDYDETSNRRWLTARWVGDESGSQRALDLAYAYDLVGNVAAITDTVASEAHSYTYDHRDRLTDWRLDGTLQQHFVYNPIGNITSFDGVAYSYDPSHSHALSSTAAGGSFGYDDAGYMESRRDATGAATWTYAWAANHKLAQISNSATDDVVAFSYGPDDERVRKSSGPLGDTYDTVTVFPFYQIESGCLRADVDCDGDVDVMDIQKVASKFNTTYTAYEQNGVNPITTVDVMLVAEKWQWEGAGGSQQVVKTYSLGGRTVAIRRGGELTYVFQDHLGSPALETDDAGNAGTRWTYEPYGTMRASEWTLPIDKGFTGQVIEQGLGLHDYGARHYAQPLGRWIAPDTVVPDPANPQSLNRYSYV